MNTIKSMEQKWGCTDPLRISDKMLDLLLLQVKEQGPIITLEGELLPPLFISELDYSELVVVAIKWVQDGFFYPDGLFGYLLHA
jgi:hypothetical protein